LNKRFPRYPDDADYQTNAPSYYEDLARKEKLIQLLAEKIWEYENTLDLKLEEITNRLEYYIEQWELNLEKFPENVELLLEEWLSDGTLDHIINETIFNWKADKTYVDAEIERLDQKDERITSQLAETMIHVKEMGAVGDGIIDDTEAIKSAINLISDQGGTLIFEPHKIYLVSDDIYIKNKGYIVVEGNQSIIKRKEMETEYSIIYYSGDITFNNLHLEGYIHWKDGNDRFPVQGFGFRSMKSSNGKTIFNNCTAYNISYDGFYHDAENGSIELNSCEAYNCYRCGIAIVGVSYAKIDGGVWGANTKRDIFGSVAAIDIEPSKSANIQYVEVINAKIPNLLNIYDSETNRITNQRIFLDNLTFDDTVVNVEHGLNVAHSLKTIIGKMTFKGNSGFLGLNTHRGRDGSNTKGSLIEFLNEEKKSSNLVKDDEFTLIADKIENFKEVTFNDIEGYQFNNLSNNSYVRYVQTIPVKRNTFYTLSAYMEINKLIGAGHGVVITLGDVEYTLQSDRNKLASYSNLIFNTLEHDEITLSLGTSQANDIDIKVGKIMLNEGFVNVE